ncbi:MAG: hypothetical protein WCL02_05035 [bacterium]
MHPLILHAIHIGTNIFSFIVAGVSFCVIISLLLSFLNNLAKSFLSIVTLESHVGAPLASQVSATNPYSIFTGVGDAVRN